jgi:DNA-binding NtrC family response regulator
MRVILVDDEVELISTMAERLRMRGISAEYAGSAREALDLIEQECYDIAVVDIKMPEIEGIELMKRMRAKCPDTQFIFLSGHGSEQTYREAIEQCPRASYLLKPIHIDALIQQMTELYQCEEDRLD